ncbi:MAG: hydroxyectoine utilization dehydratase EutB [Peptococcaceae bacterium]
MNDSQPAEEVRLPTIRDIWKARLRIYPRIKKTPVIKSPVLSEKSGSAVYLKLETCQKTGAFKIRGAANKIMSLSPREQQHGVTTFSTGNHGLAVAYLAGRLKIPAVICISDRVPENKVQALRSYGARIIIHGHSQDDAQEHCYHLAENEGLTVIEPFDDPYIIAGQGTIALELLADLPEIDTVLVPLSGGGLLAGIALALKATDSKIKVIGVSMQEGAVMYHSIRAGKPVKLPEADTLADSLLGGIGPDNKYTLPLLQKYVDDTVLVSEEAIARGMAFLCRNNRLLVEGAAAVGIAALAEHNLASPGSNAAVIISGNNVDVPAFLAATKKYL